MAPTAPPVEPKPEAKPEAKPLKPLAIRKEGEEEVVYLTTAQAKAHGISLATGEPKRKPTQRQLEALKAARDKRVAAAKAKRDAIFKPNEQGIPTELPPTFQSDANRKELIRDTSTLPPELQGKVVKVVREKTKNRGSRKKIVVDLVESSSSSDESYTSSSSPSPVKTKRSSRKKKSQDEPPTRAPQAYNPYSNIIF